MGGCGRDLEHSSTALSTLISWDASVSRTCFIAGVTRRPNNTRGCCLACDPEDLAGGWCGHLPGKALASTRCFGERQEHSKCSLSCTDSNPDEIKQKELFLAAIWLNTQCFSCCCQLSQTLNGFFSSDSFCSSDQKQRFSKFPGCCLGPIFKRDLAETHRSHLHSWS